MLVTHGHQFDPYNCPENELLGMLIANTVGTFADQQADPFLDLRGIAMNGNPLVDFGEMLSARPSSTAGRTSNRRLSSRTTSSTCRTRSGGSSTASSTRRPSPRCSGCYGLSIDHVDAQGTTISSGGNARRHEPHRRESHPDLHRTPPRPSPVPRPHPQPAQSTLRRDAQFHAVHPRRRLADHRRARAYRERREGCRHAGRCAGKLLDAEPLLKTNYFNSGTVGWMQGVIWAIEIDATGQARLVFWTEKSHIGKDSGRMRDTTDTGPETMDWELTVMDPNLKQALPAAARDALPNLVSAVDQEVGNVLKGFTDEVARYRTSTEEYLDSVERRLSVPLEAIGASIAKGGSTVATSAAVVLEVVRAGEKDAADMLLKAGEKAHDFLLDVFTTIKARTLGQGNSGLPTQHFSIAAEISSELAGRLGAMRELLLNSRPALVRQDEALHIGGMSLGVFELFPRNWPFFGGIGGTQRAERFLNDIPDPSGKMVLLLLPFFPPNGRSLEIGSDRLTSSFTLEGNRIALEVTISSDPSEPRV